jgi:hypothetical protein
MGVLWPHSFFADTDPAKNLNAVPYQSKRKNEENIWLSYYCREVMKFSIRESHEICRWQSLLHISIKLCYFRKKLTVLHENSLFLGKMVRFYFCKKFFLMVQLHKNCHKIQNKNHKWKIL